jgi:hypothetical protein
MTIYLRRLQVCSNRAVSPPRRIARPRPCRAMSAGRMTVSRNLSRLSGFAGRVHERGCFPMVEVTPWVSTFWSMPLLPAPELMAKLLLAYQPCAAFGGECPKNRWDPAHGHVSRGFLGAIGSLREVRLVLLTAEPGDPLEGERYSRLPGER